MRRRAFIAGVGAAVLPMSIRAQPAMPVVGYVRSTTAAGFENLVVALRLGLKEAGFVEGQNVAVEYHYADNRTERLSALIASLVRRPVNVIVGNVPTALVAKAATTTVPVVFVAGSDPVREGLVTSLNRPGSNVTGASFMATAVAAKRLDLLRQLVPQVTTIAVLVDPRSPTARAERSDISAAAQALGLRLPVFEVASEHEIDAAIVSAVQGGAGALIVGGGGFLNSQRDRLVALAVRHKLPASFIVREGVAAGGLMSYGPSQTDAYRQAGIYVGRILKGERPADMPVMQATKFEFVINLKTAKTLGLEFHPQLLATADEVIE